MTEWLYFSLQHTPVSKSTGFWNRENYGPLKHFFLTFLGVTNCPKKVWPWWNFLSRSNEWMNEWMNEWTHQYPSPQGSGTEKIMVHWNIFFLTFLGVTNCPKKVWPWWNFLSRSNEGGQNFQFASEKFKCRPLTCTRIGNFIAIFFVNRSMAHAPPKKNRCYWSKPPPPKKKPKKNQSYHGTWERRSILLDMHNY